MPQIISYLVIIFIITLQCESQDVDLHKLQRVKSKAAVEAESKDFSRNGTEELAKQWESYYNCQKQEYQHKLGHHSTPNIKAIAAFEGSHVNMSCRVCLSPRQQDSDISWHVTLDREVQPLNISGSELHFDNLALDQHGEYLCKFVDLVRAVYLLHVLHEPDEPIQQVHQHREPRVRNASRLATGVGEVEVFSEWGAWSSCSEAHHCGHVGHRVRHGPCMVTLNDSSRLDKSLKSLVKFFPHGLPCRSPLLPPSVQAMTQLQERPSEIILGFCKIRCSKQPKDIFKVWDNKGKLVDKVNNSAGIFSSLQNIPKLPPSAARVYLFPYIGDCLTVKCPGHKESDSPVQWHKGRTPITRREIALLTEERVTINVLTHIVVKEVHLKDTNIYSCWQEGRLVGTVKIRVMSRDVAMSKLHWSLFMAVIILSVLLLGIYRIYKQDTK